MASTAGGRPHLCDCAAISDTTSTPPSSQRPTHKPLLLAKRGNLCAIVDGSVAGWSSLVARWAHNPKVVGSNPAPATKVKERRPSKERRRFAFWRFRRAFGMALPRITDDFARCRGHPLICGSADSSLHRSSKLFDHPGFGRCHGHPPLHPVGQALRRQIFVVRLFVLIAGRGGATVWMPLMRCSRPLVPECGMPYPADDRENGGFARLAGA